MPSRAKRRQLRLSTRRETDVRRDLISQSMTLRSATINEEERSIEAVFATDAPVAVFDWMRYEPIDEVLRADGAELPSQVVLLDTHSRYSLDDVLGSGRAMRRDGNAIVGRLFFDTEDERGKRAWNKVRGGHVTDVSVGYRALEYVDIPAGQSQMIAGQRYTAGKRTLRITTRWALREISVVPIGADSAAKMRGDEFSQSDKERAMNKRLRSFLETLGLRADADDAAAWTYFDGLQDAQRAVAIGLHNTDPQGRAAISEAATPPANSGTPPAARPARTDASPPVDAAAARTAGADAEFERCRAIREAAGGEIPRELVDRAINERWTVERSTREFLDHMRGQMSPPAGGNVDPNRAPAGHSRSRERDTNVRTLAAGVARMTGLNPVGLALRGGGLIEDDRGRAIALTEQDADIGDRYHLRSLWDVCREALRFDGVREPRDEGEFFRAAFSTLSIQAVFTTSAYARLVEGYTLAPDTTMWCQEEDLANFMTHDDITLGKMATPKKLPRGGEAKHGTLSTETESYAAIRYANQLQIDEQDIIDDRLDAISGVVREMGETYQAMRPDLVYALLLRNPTLTADSTAVFAAGHSNQATDALSRTAIQSGAIAMNKQRINGRVVNNPPAYLIVPSDLQFTAAQILGSSVIIPKGNTDGEQGTVNPVQALGLRQITEGRLTSVGVFDPMTEVQVTGSATNWWLMSNRRTVKVLYRRGTGRRPSMRTSVLSQGRWGINWDINLDIGAAFLDFRGAYRGNT